MHAMKGFIVFTEDVAQIPFSNQAATSPYINIWVVYMRISFRRDLALLFSLSIFSMKLALPQPIILFLAFCCHRCFSRLWVLTSSIFKDCDFFLVLILDDDTTGALSTSFLLKSSSSVQQWLYLCGAYVYSGSSILFCFCSTWSRDGTWKAWIFETETPPSLSPLPQSKHET